MGGGSTHTSVASSHFDDRLLVGLDEGRPLSVHASAPVSMRRRLWSRMFHVFDGWRGTMIAAHE